jgi:hypothetical protein
MKILQHRNANIKVAISLSLQKVNCNKALIRTKSITANAIAIKEGLKIKNKAYSNININLA